LPRHDEHDVLRLTDYLLEKGISLRTVTAAV